VNKAQFVEALTARMNSDRRAATEALDAVIDTVYAAVARGEKVGITGFGVFEKRERAARTARNPATGAAVKVKKTSVPAFRAGTEFRAITAGTKKLAKAPGKKAAAGGPAKKAGATKAASGAATKSAAKSAGTKAAGKAAPRKAAAKKTARS
jgi:DNA-binding protein HU-beta